MIEGTRPVLEVRSLTKTYGDARVLDAVDLDVAPGEVHALLVAVAVLRSWRRAARGEQRSRRRPPGS